MVSVLETVADKQAAGGAASAGESTIEDIGGTAPHMKVLDLAGRPCPLTEQFEGTAASGWMGNLVKDVHSIHIGQGPVVNVGDSRPVDILMMEHGPRDRH